MEHNEDFVGAGDVGGAYYSGTRSVDEDFVGFCDEFARISVFVGICAARKLWELRERAGRG